KRTIERGRPDSERPGFLRRNRNGLGLIVEGKHQSSARDVAADIKHNTPDARIGLVLIGRNRVSQRNLHVADVILLEMILASIARPSGPAFGGPNDRLRRA